MRCGVESVNDLWRVTLYGLASGVAGTAAGGLLACFLPGNNARFNGWILEYSAGLMIAVVCFDLLPGAFGLASLKTVMSGMLVGIIVMAISGALLRAEDAVGAVGRTGVIIAIGIALHNFPEGLAVGSGFEAEPALGFALAVTIMLHDIPEGAAIAVPLRAGGASRRRAFLWAAASGLPMGLGALLGALAGRLSGAMIAFCLATAGGAMLYVVFSDMLPQAQKMRNKDAAAVGIILGMLTGVLASVKLAS